MKNNVITLETSLLRIKRYNNTCTVAETRERLPDSRPIFIYNSRGTLITDFLLISKQLPRNQSANRRCINHRAPRVIAGGLSPRDENGE